MLLHIRYNSREEQDYIIVNDFREAVPGNRILHYSSPDARELLTAAFHESRNRKGELGDKQFCVMRSFFKRYSQNGNPDDIVPITLSIKQGGGLYFPQMSKNLEIVDMLLYSPFTRRYEIIKATHNKDEEYSYVDICLYRSFVKEFGNPKVEVIFEHSFGGRGDWEQLQTESVLKEYGYSVSQADNLSDRQRRELLAELIDLGIMKAERIISHLDFVIRAHPLPKDDIPRFKWSKDREFVENYRANPSRFLIAK